MSHVIRKPAFCIFNNKGIDQLCGRPTTDQLHCFHYTDSTITLLPSRKSQASNNLMWLYSLVGTPVDRFSHYTSRLFCSFQANQITISKQRKSSKKVVNTQRRIRKTGSKTYDCDQCDKRYTTSDYLIFHKRSKHTGERPYVCQHCGKSFVCSSCLNSHKYVHKETTPFTCEQCGRCFKRQDYLWRHKLTHAPARRQFVCDVCGKSYVDPSNLRRHKLTHVDKRPHGCEVCGGSFRTAGDLSKHQRLHTGEKPFTCDRCGESFRLKLYMQKHQKRKHAM